jgi:hypothetical protein
VQGNTRLAAVLFAALSVEPPGSRAALQEALQGLAAALTAAVGTGQQAPPAAAAAAAGKVGSSEAMTAAELADLEELLLTNIKNEQVCCAVLCCAVLCCAVLCCAVLCCAVLCCAVLCCAVLCCMCLCGAGDIPGDDDGAAS